MSAAEPADPQPGRLAVWVIRLRWPLVALWVAALALALTQLPTLGSGGASTAVDDIVPTATPALAVQARAVQLFGVPAGSDVVTVQRRASGLAGSDLARHVQAARAAFGAGQRPGADLRGAVPLANVPVASARWREHGTTILDYVLVDPSASLDARSAIGRRYARTVGAGGVTGSAPARLDQYQQIEDVLPWLTLATIAVIALVVTLYFRSLLAPLVTLGTAGLAYVIAVRGLAWAGEHASITVPREIEPLLVVLLLGLVTDYSVFFMAEARRQLRLGCAPREAAALAVSRVAPSVLVAGTIVAASSCALLVADLKFFRTFGPGLAGCALVVTIVAVTLVPALIGILGSRLFGRRGQPVPIEDEPIRAPDVPLLRHGAGGERRRRRMAGALGAVRAGRREARAEGRSAAAPIMARVLASRPIALLLVLLCLAGMGLAAAQARRLELGLSFIAGLPADSPAHKAADQAAQGFAGGITAPTDVVLQGSGLGARSVAVERLRREIDARHGVAATLGPAEQAAASPSAAQPHPLATQTGNAARIVVVFGGDPTAAGTISDLHALRDAMPGLMRAAGLPAGTSVGFAGETALGAETVHAVSADFRRIAAAIAVVTLVLLILFLRALVAPLLLLGASALGYLAALGLTTLAIERIYGDRQITYYVPLVGAVLLVALGSDYNVLVAGRIRAESASRRIREALAVAVPQASRAVTLAGVTLAATFAMLAIVPLRSFRELALLLTIGVLLDTFVVRSVLVPSLVSVAGARAWWPGRARRPLAPDVVVPGVATALGTTPAAALPETRVTLGVLAERIGERQAEELALHLPPELADALADPPQADAFDAAEFVRRVGERTGLSRTQAERTVRAVLGTLVASIPATELDYVRAALSDDYAALFPEAPVAGGVPAAGHGAPAA